MTHPMYQPPAARATVCHGDITIPLKCGDSLPRCKDVPVVGGGKWQVRLGRKIVFDGETIGDGRVDGGHKSGYNKSLRLVDYCWREGAGFWWLSCWEIRIYVFIHGVLKATSK